MKAKDIREMSTEDIETQVIDYIRTLKELRYSHYVQPIENPNRINLLRKDIARFHTELNARLNQVTE